LNEENKKNYRRKINLKTKSTLTRRFKDFDRINLAKIEQKDKKRIEEQQEKKITKNKRKFINDNGNQKNEA
jgi:hypothetical protein